MRLMFICLLTIATIALAPGTSSAKVLITRGDAFTHLGDPKSKTFEGQPLPAGMSVGFKYSYFGIFWLDLWRWDGEYCMYKDKEYIPITQAQAATILGVSESSLGEPFFFKFPPGLFIAAGIGLIVVISFVVQQQKKQKVMALVGEPVYQKALDAFRQQVDENEDTKKEAAEKSEPEPENLPDPWQAAIAQLTAGGIDRKEAEENFGKVLTYALGQSTQTASK